jgi:hypothetical protein
MSTTVWDPRHALRGISSIWSRAGRIKNPPLTISALNTVDVIVTLLVVTDKLVLVSLHGDREGAVWLSRAAISITGTIAAKRDCVITLSKQLARKKKLISDV